MIKIEHIGIAVHDLEKSELLFEKLLGVPKYKTEKVSTENVTTSFYTIGESKIELLQGQDPDSAITKYLERRGEGIHHIAFLVDDIQKEIKRLKEEGFEFVADQPKNGADNKIICFLHPKKTNGVLIELCQEMKK